MSLPTEDLLAVPIMSVGGPVKCHGCGPEGIEITKDDLVAYAKDTSAVLDEVKPFNKLGHNTAQILARRSGFYEDEQPRTGNWTNFRVSEDGTKLLADVKGVPKKLATLIKAGAFGERSIEEKPYESQKGKGRYERVIRAISWLGAKAPAIKTLDDVVALYGDDEVDDSELRILTFSEETTAVLDVRVDLATEESRESGSEADTRVEMSDTKTPALALDDDQLKQLAASLGVEGDEITADTLIAKAAEVKLAAEAKETEGEGEGEGEGSGDGEGSGEGSGSGEGDGEGSGESGRMLSDAEYYDLKSRADAGAEAAAKLAKMERDEVIGDALKTGRIDPAQKDEFEKLYAESPEFVTRTLAALPENEERSKTFGSEEEHDFTEDDERLYEEYAAFAGIETEAAA